MAGYVYIITNRPRGVLYIGVTSDLVRRIYEHKQHVVEGFSKRYGLDRLVYFEPYEAIGTAIQREKAMKHWVRQWKVNAIEGMNPGWEDLYERIVA